MMGNRRVSGVWIEQWTVLTHIDSLDVTVTY